MWISCEHKVVYSGDNSWLGVDIKTFFSQISQSLRIDKNRFFVV